MSVQTGEGTYVFLRKHCSSYILKCFLLQFKENGYTFRGGNSAKMDFASLMKGVYSKSKECTPLEWDFFQKGVGQESEQEAAKVVSL